MKIKYLYLLIITTICFSACKKDEYASGSLSPIIALVDLKDIYKNGDVTLTAANMGGAHEIVGVVISDHSAGNVPEGVLVVQNNRRNAVRGIAIDLGADAANYVPGDSVIIQVEGAKLTRVNGSMRLTGVAATAIAKVDTGKTVKVQAVPATTLMASPDAYESTVITVSKAITVPEPQAGDTYAGDKKINDGFGDITLHTSADAAFASAALPASADFTGIAFISNAGGKADMQLWMRTADDAFPLPLIKPSPVIITGYLTNPAGGDGNYEYIQLLATRDIDFSTTNFAIVTCNNAGTNPPPAKGWAEGLAKTYKFNLTSGTVTKGQFFYVGGNKNIYGAGSTDISTAKWIVSKLYADGPGEDFGNATANLLANSGNVAGIAVFQGVTVDATSVPLDVIMYGGNGTVYSAGPPEIGYRITNTEYYSTINPLTRQTQGFYGGGTNVQKLPLPTDGTFVQLGGIYNATTGRWQPGRTVTSVPLTLTSPLSTLETGVSSTTLSN
jgi:hypothetical protein